MRQPIEAAAAETYDDLVRHGEERNALLASIAKLRTEIAARGRA